MNNILVNRLITLHLYCKHMIYFEVEYSIMSITSEYANISAISSGYCKKVDQITNQF